MYREYRFAALATLLLAVALGGYLLMAARFPMAYLAGTYEALYGEWLQFYLFAALGSVADLTLGDGSIQARYQYDAWGNPRATVGAS